MIKVIDDLLGKQDFQHIRDTLLNNSAFPWRFNDHKVQKDASDDIYDMQFVHMFYKDFMPKSEYFDILKPFLLLQRPNALIRVKANLTPPTPEIYQYGMHTDVPTNGLPVKTAVYYVNDNDGATVFENGEKVGSVANRFVVFDADMLHAGTSCTNAKCRCVINFNFI